MLVSFNHQLNSSFMTEMFSHISPKEIVNVSFTKSRDNLYQHPSLHFLYRITITMYNCVKLLLWLNFQLPWLWPGLDAFLVRQTPKPQKSLLKNNNNNANNNKIIDQFAQLLQFSTVDHTSQIVTRPKTPFVLT